MAIHAINADLGTTMFYGILVAIPTVIIAGPLYGTWVARRVHPAPSPELLAQLAKDTEPQNPPTFGVTLFTILLPVVLTLLAIPYLIGHETRSPRRAVPLSPTHAFAWGSLLLGMALCTHAWFFRNYENHPVVKYVVLAVGIASLAISLWLDLQ